MKVSFLRAILANYPPDAEVIVRKLIHTDQVAFDVETDIEIESIQLSEDSKKVIINA